MRRREMYTFSVEAPLKVATKSFLASAGEEKTDLLLPPSLPSTAYRSSRTIKRHSLFKSAPIHNTKWRRSTAPITALCIRNPSRTVTRRRHFVPRSCFPFPSFTLDPRPQKLDETAECRPRARLLLLLLFLFLLLLFLLLVLLRATSRIITLSFHSDFSTTPLPREILPSTEISKRKRERKGFII